MLVFNCSTIGVLFLCVLSITVSDADELAESLMPCYHEMEAEFKRNSKFNSTVNALIEENNMTKLEKVLLNQVDKVCTKENATKIHELDKKHAKFMEAVKGLLTDISTEERYELKTMILEEDYGGIIAFLIEKTFVWAFDTENRDRLAIVLKEIS